MVGNYVVPKLRLPLSALRPDDAGLFFLWGGGKVEGERKRREEGRRKIIV